MNYKKTIVCLANSFKESQRCVAGKEIDVSGNATRWIRPISNLEHGKIDLNVLRYQNGQLLQILDKVEIEFIEPRPYSCQRENHLIDESIQWLKVGTCEFNELINFVDNEDEIWINNESSTNGFYDRMSNDECERLESSLMLIKVDKLKIIVHNEHISGTETKKKIRGAFEYKEIDYKFSITDPIYYNEYIVKPESTYVLEPEVYLCISLTEPFRGYRYKLIATIIANNN